MDNWEIYYRTHTKGVGKELTGSPPLSFVSNGQPLSDYRIDGSSGGVGDKTDNLWNEKATTDTDKYIDASGNIVTGVAGERYLYLKVNVSPSTNYVFKWTESVRGIEGSTSYIRISEYTQSNRFIRRVLCKCSEQTQKAFSFTTNSNTSYIDVRTESATSRKGQHLTGVMLITGTIPPETYEPYGYKIPIVCGGTTTNIYLDEPLRKTSKLPTGYTQVEYLESTGTQYIDTGIKTNTTTSRYETKINPSLVSGTIGIFGTRNGSIANQSSMNVFIIDGTFHLDWLNGAMGSSVRISSNTEYAISITRGLATINNVNYKIGENTSIDGSYTFYVGSFNNVGSVYSNGFSGKIYYSKLYNNNILVFDGVPCYRKSDNEIGMYDLVSNTFFTNAGTGSFIAGAEVETVYYTDYIDYAAQKRHNSDGTESSVTLPEISTLAGTNTLTVGTEVQPSNMYIKYVGSNVNQSLMKYLEYKYKFAKE